MILTGFVVKWGFFLVNRCASWFGSSYYIKKAFQERKKRYAILAILISVALFLLMMKFLKKS